MKTRTRWAVGLCGILLAAAQPAAALEYGELAAVSRSENRSDLFGVDAGDHSVWHMWQETADGPWVGPEALSGAVQDVSAVMTSDDRFEVFAAGSGNEILHTAQDYDDWAWQAWTVMFGEAKRVAAAKAEDGTVGVFYVGTDDSIWYGTRATPDDAFSDWTSLELSAKDVAVTAANGGGFDAYALGQDGQTYLAHVDPSAPESPAWESLGGTAFSISALHAQDRDYLAAIGTDAVWVKTRDSENGWSDWQNLGGYGTRIDTVAVNGSVAVLTVASDASVSRSNLGEDGTWSDWSSVVEASPLQTTFRGKARVQIPDQDVDEDRSIDLGIRFDVARQRVKITSFPSITTDKFDTPFGSSTSTVTLTGGGDGTFDPGSGNMEIPVSLKFDQSLDVPLISEDVRANFTLSTDARGAAYDRDTGDITLAASSTLDGIGGGVNPLDGLRVDIEIAGTLDPKP